MTTVQDIIARIEEYAPKYLAEDWDPIGLSIGSRQQKVKKMLVALDLDANTLQEAKDKEIDFVFTHHPAIFSPLKTLNEEDSRRSEYIELIRSNISLYSAHTNVDAAENGMNDWLAKAIGLEKPYELMGFSYEDSFKLLTIYVSLHERLRIMNRLAEINEGAIKAYNPSLFSAEDESTTVMTKSSVSSDRIDIIVPDYLIDTVIAMLYEINLEQIPAYHLTAIEKSGESYGIGRVGSLKESISINELIERVKEAYSTPAVRTSNLDLEQKVKKIAVLGGSGEKYYKQALTQGADLYITGDIGYHGAQDMIREGLPFIDPGHFIENIFVNKMTSMLKEWNEVEEWDIEIIPSTSQKDVFTFK